jgi:hypothetical protein
MTSRMCMKLILILMKKSDLHLSCLMLLPDLSLSPGFRILGSWISSCPKVIFGLSN